MSDAACPVCERTNGVLVHESDGAGGTYAMCRPCQRITDMVAAAPLDAYRPELAEDIGAWMRRLQDENPATANPPAAAS